jgi:DNA-binding SARP family transcriptional activator/tetratricopeptide (TPR) repeat protein
MRSDGATGVGTLHDVAARAAGASSPEVVAHMKYSLLGPLEVHDDDGVRHQLSSPKLRALLALLLIEANRVVPLDRLIDQLWAGEPPASSTATLQAYIWQLRKLLEPRRESRAPAQVLVTEPPGYLLRVADGDLDLTVFEKLVTVSGDQLVAGEAEAARRSLDEALGLWRGTPLIELADEPFAVSVATRLEELHLLARERRIDVELALGRPADAVALAEDLSARHPLREHIWAQRMVGLYRSGRQAEALRTYQDCRALLADELGIEPGLELRELERAVLAQDDAVLRPGASVPSRRAGDLAPVAEAPTTQPAVAAAPGVRAGGALVGRDTELAVLREAQRALAGRRGRVIALEGEAGIGKTRLVEQLVTEASRDGLRVAWTRCVADAGSPPLWPWHELLTQLAATAVDGLDPARRIDLTGGGHDTAGDASDPDHDRFLLLSSAVDQMVEHSRSAPTVLVVDDLHSADAVSLQLLRLLLDRVDDHALLVLTTLRRAEAKDRRGMDETLTAIGRSRAGIRLPIGPLEERDVDELLRAMSERDEEPLGRDSLASFSHTLYQRTGGNPFFLTELVKLLGSERRLPDGASDPLADHGDIPVSIRDVISRRVERLPDDTQTLLRIAAVAATSSGSVDLDLLSDAARLDIDRTAELVEPAVLTEVLLEQDDGWSWRFSHDLGRDAIIASLTRLQRSRLHALVGESLERLRGEQAMPPVDELAAQFAAAGRSADPQRALRWAQAAADAARQRYSWDQSAVNRRRVTAALDLIPDASTEDRIDARIELARDLRLNGDLHDARQTIEEALGLATAIGDTRRLAAAASIFGGATLWNWRDFGVVDHRMVGLLDQLSTSPELDERRRAELLGTLAVELYYGEQRPRGVTAGREAVAIARGIGNVELLGRTLNNLTIASWEPKNDDERLALTTEAIDLVSQGLPLHTEVIARMHRLALRLRRGDREGYEADLQRAVEIAATLAVPEVSAQVTYKLSTRSLLLGDPEQALSLAEAGREQLTRTDMWGADWCHFVQRSNVEWFRGDLASMADELVRACESPRFAGLRPVAVLAAHHAGDTSSAVTLSQRWYEEIQPNWSSDFQTGLWGLVAGEVGSPHPDVILEPLGQLGHELLTAGTAVSCWGPTDLILAQLVARAGRSDEVAPLIERARRLIDRTRFAEMHALADRTEARLGLRD